MIVYQQISIDQIRVRPIHTSAAYFELSIILLYDWVLLVRINKIIDIFIQ